MRFEDFKGKYLESVERTDVFHGSWGKSEGQDCLRFTFADGTVVEMGHEQDCCESVYLEDFDETLFTAKGPIYKAEERIDSQEAEWGSVTYTFYTFSPLYFILVIIPNISIVRQYLLN